MPDTFKLDHELDHISSPVTALAYLCSRSTTLLLAGEGPLLRVFDDGAHHFLGAVRVFRTQAIHGIQIRGTVAGNDAEDALPHVLVWGGRSVCCIRLDLMTAGLQGRWQLQCHFLVSETRASDWILSSCFLSNSPFTQHDVGATHLDMVLLTAHNVVLSFNVPLCLNEGSAESHETIEVAAGPRSILYSGHLVLLSSGKVLVAAGTVFGEVLLWSCIVGGVPSMSMHVKSSLLHHIFLGHEGSVFGVRVSDEISVPGSDAVQRILASCSDDRTIRIWDISDVINGIPIDWHEDTTTTSGETGFATSNKLAGRLSSNLLAVAMGHLSRIWGVRFISHCDSIQRLLSYGEDASLQIWEFDLIGPGPKRSSSKVPEIPHRALRHLDTHKFHSGKHIWSVALLAAKDGPWKVTTGGSDGCVAYYDIPLCTMREQCVSLWSMKDVWDKCGGQANGPNTNSAPTVTPSRANSLTKATFTSLEGKWVLKRSIESALSSYPSGTFEGGAVFRMRPPMDRDYDMEYLYAEEGDFTTKKGLSFHSSRRYVYRYQAGTDTISVWFVDVDDKKSMDYLFHHLDFPKTDTGDPQLTASDTGSWMAKGYHLCVKDDYWVDYHFTFVGENLGKWNLQYNVKGPEKDYVADANYTRLEKVDQQSKPACNSLTVVRKARHARNTLTGFRRPDLCSQDSFKSYAWVCDVDFLVTTEQGHILLGTLQNAKQPSTHGFQCKHFSKVVSWELLTQLDHLKSYCIATSVPENGIAFLSGTEGTIYLYQHRGKSISRLVSLPRKLSGLFAQALCQTQSAAQKIATPTGIGMVALCLGSVTAKALILEMNPSCAEDPGPSIARMMTLSLPPAFIVTSAGFADPQKLICLGSRSGALALYDISAFSDDETGIAVSCCVRHVHGEDAITVIGSIPIAQSDADSSSGYLLTTGRDGRYAVHRWKLEPELQSSKLTFETVHVGAPSFGPNIEGAVFLLSTQDVIFWGFRSKHFVVWNQTKQREVMAVECGGAHRSWAFSPGVKNEELRMSLVWTKASTCYVDSRPHSSYEVLQGGGHGREIKTMAVSPLQDHDSDVCRRLVATGAEDTAIRIFIYKVSSSDVYISSLQCIGSFAEHTTGLQQLRWSKDGRYLFSAAGCEEFYAWRVQRVPFFDFGVVCDTRCPVTSESADLRIMDFDVVELDGEDGKPDKTNPRFFITMVYSDSSVRMYCFDPASLQAKFELLLEGLYGTSCLTQVLTIHLGHEIYLCTASTDGYIAFWPFSTTSEEQGIINTINQLHRNATLDPCTPATPISWTSRTRIHQNSIKSMTAVHLSDYETILASAGDDDALAFTRLTSSTNPTITPSTTTLLIPAAHPAAITALQYLGPVLNDSTTPALSQHRFVTSGPDQRLKFWLLRVDMERAGTEGMEVAKVWNGYTSVADVACLDSFEWVEDGCGRVFVAGIGVEVWRIGKGEVGVVRDIDEEVRL